MEPMTLVRVLAVGVLIVTAVVFLGAAGLWGLAVAAPALLLLPRRKTVVVREDPVTVEQALAVWSRDHGSREG